MNRKLELPLRRSVQEMARLILDLHRENLAGREDGPAADKIKAHSETLWREIGEDERCILHGLSADLHMLAQAEILENSGQDRADSARALHAALDLDDAFTVLEVLRQLPRVLSEHDVAYLRWRCYSKLGLLEPAQIFLDYARDTRHRDEDILNTLKQAC